MLNHQTIFRELEVDYIATQQEKFKMEKFTWLLFLSWSNLRWLKDLVALEMQEVSEE